VPFGKRAPKDITFDVTPTFEAHGVDFVLAPATAIDPIAKTVATALASYRYDYLVIATGYRTTSTSFLASGPAGTPTRSPRWPTRCTPEPAGVVCSKSPAMWVIGVTQGAGCFGAAYEFLFNTAYQLKKAGLKKKVKLSYVTSEPFHGHFGIGGLPHGEQLLGMFLKEEGINAITNVSMQHVDKDAIVLADSRELPFRYAVVVPPFVGQDFLKNVDGIADEKGYIKAGTPTRPRSSTTSTRSARKQRCADTGRQDAPASEHGVLIPGPQATR
jgi:sulfide:quinone oxidoreductase